MCVFLDPLGPGCAAARRRPVRCMMCLARSLPATVAPVELLRKGAAIFLRAFASASSAVVRKSFCVAAVVAGPRGGSTISEQQLGSCSQAVSTDFGTYGLICAL